MSSEADFLSHRHLSKEQELTAIKKLCIPAFCRFNPAFWFANIESQFRDYQIVSDAIKLDVIMGYLGNQLFDEVSDIFLGLPMKIDYACIKQKLISKFTELAEEELDRIEFENKRPSSLLNEMRDIVNNNIPDGRLSVLWMNRMPTLVQRILSTNDGIPLETLAKIADRIVENTSNTKSGNGVQQQLSGIEKTLSGLNISLNNRSKSRLRNRSKSRSSKRKPTQRDMRICKYHQWFGVDARKCRGPCGYLLTFI